MYVGSSDVQSWAASANSAAASPVDGFVLGFNGGAAADGSGDSYAGVCSRKPEFALCLVSRRGELTCRNEFVAIVVVRRRARSCWRAPLPWFRSNCCPVAMRFLASCGSPMEARGHPMYDLLNVDSLEQIAEALRVFLDCTFAFCVCVLVLGQAILELVANGVDIIDCALPVESSRLHRALVFPMLHDGARLSKDLKTEFARDTLAERMEAFTAQQEAIEYAEDADDDGANGSSNAASDTDSWRDALFTAPQPSHGEEADDAHHAQSLHYSDLFEASSQPVTSVDLFQKKFELDQRPLVADCGYAGIVMPRFFRGAGEVECS